MLVTDVTSLMLETVCVDDEASDVHDKYVRDSGMAGPLTISTRTKTDKSVSCTTLIKSTTR